MPDRIRSVAANGEYGVGTPVKVFALHRPGSDEIVVVPGVIARLPDDPTFDGLADILVFNWPYGPIGCFENVPQNSNDGDGPYWCLPTEPDIEEG